MCCAKRDHDIQQRFYRFGNKSLQYVALDRQTQTRQRSEMTGMTGYSKSDFRRLNVSTRCAHADNALVLTDKTDNLAVLDNINTALVSATRKSPGNGIVAGVAGARLQ